MGKFILLSNTTFLIVIDSLMINCRCMLLKCDICLCGQQIWGDSDALSLAQSLGIENSLKSLSSVTDPPKVGSHRKRKVTRQISRLIKYKLVTERASKELFRDFWILKKLVHYLFYVLIFLLSLLASLALFLF